LDVELIKDVGLDDACPDYEIEGNATKHQINAIGRPAFFFAAYAVGL